MPEIWNTASLDLINLHLPFPEFSAPSPTDPFKLLIIILLYLSADCLCLPYLSRHWAPRRQELCLPGSRNPPPGAFHANVSCHRDQTRDHRGQVTYPVLHGGSAKLCRRGSQKRDVRQNSLFPQHSPEVSQVDKVCLPTQSHDLQSPKVEDCLPLRATLPE